MAKILVIDDEPGIRGVIREVLEDADHEVIDFEDGRGALEYVRDEDTDLIITDIFMPEMEGLETIRLIRRLCPAVPIIAISGVDFDGKDYLGIAKKFGAVSTLKKPFLPRDLLAVVLGAGVAA